MSGHWDGYLNLDAKCKFAIKYDSFIDEILLLAKGALLLAPYSQYQKRTAINSFKYLHL